ncbi:MAG: OmpA family protein [Lautropia sp.]|nr:OmpA family protein [Lautropia sp.]
MTAFLKNDVSTPAARRGVLALSVASALVLGACASTQPNPVVEQARSHVDKVAAQPEVAGRAALELKAAKDTLARADKVWTGDKDQAEAEHLAYLATQQASTAEALANARANDAKLQETKGKANQLRLDARTAEVEAARADAASARARADELQAQMNALEAKKTDRGLLVTFGDVLFAFGKAELLPSSSDRLDKLAQFLMDNPERKLRVEGYTDSVGSAGYNQKLSERRADAVKLALVRRGIAADRITSVGYGKDYPVATNSSDAGRAMNRRVEVVIADEKGVLRSR